MKNINLILGVILSDIDRDKIITLFRKKAEEMNKVPTCTDIQKDKRMPSYEEFRSEFGRIRESSALKDIVDKYKTLAKINKTFCNDCIRNPDNCGRNIEDCRKDAELYYRKYDDLK